MNSRTVIPGGISNYSTFVVVNARKWESIGEADRKAIEALAGENIARSLGKIVDAVCSVSTDELIVSPIILTQAQIEESRRREVLLVADLDREGIPL